MNVRVCVGADTKGLPGGRSQPGDVVCGKQGAAMPGCESGMSPASPRRSSLARRSSLDQHNWHGGGLHRARLPVEREGSPVVRDSVPVEYNEFPVKHEETIPGEVVVFDEPLTIYSAGVQSRGAIPARRDDSTGHTCWSRFWGWRGAFIYGIFVLFWPVFGNGIFV